MMHDNRSITIIKDTDLDAEPVIAPSCKERHCLMCQTKFISQWRGERVCQKCKSRGVWREGDR